MPRTWVGFSPRANRWVHCPGEKMRKSKSRSALHEWKVGKLAKCVSCQRAELCLANFVVVHKLHSGFHSVSRWYFYGTVCQARYFRCEIRTKVCGVHFPLSPKSAPLLPLEPISPWWFIHFKLLDLTLFKFDSSHHSLANSKPKRTERGWSGEWKWEPCLLTTISLFLINQF